MDVPLFLYFVFFYIGNYGYSITNKLALKASGSPHGYPLTISALQLGIGCLYAIFLWLAPDARSHPQITPQDLLKMIPVAFCTAGSHSASVFGYAHGSVSFVSIVKAAEPVFAAILSQFVYQRPVSLSKWLCLPIIISGVVLASVSEVNFSWTALASACVANLIAAFRGNETKKLLQTEGLKDRIGGAGNQFALTAILGFLMWAPLALLKEGDGLPHFVGLLKNTTENDLRKWLVVSAFFYYGYNELRTVTLKKTSAVTGSVANTLKRVIVIVGVALALGEPLGPLKILGSMVAVGGVFLYSIVE
jgi:solute carrier family 35 protein E1